jgi:hypothetical protein
MGFVCYYSIDAAIFPILSCTLLVFSTVLIGAPKKHLFANAPNGFFIFSLEQCVEIEHLLMKRGRESKWLASTEQNELKSLNRS